MSWLSRRKEQVYAFTHSYFWLPCPLCGDYFGGHEAHGSMYQGCGSGVLVCLRCTAGGKKRGLENFNREFGRTSAARTEQGGNECTTGTA